MQDEWQIHWLNITWWSWPPDDLPVFWATIIAAAIALYYAYPHEKASKGNR